MKSTALATAALLAVITAACGGNRDDVNENVNPIGTAGEGGAVGGDLATRAAGDDDVAEFVRDAAIHGTAEVELSRLAGERGTNAEVKQFAQMMVREHSRANEELMSAVQGHLQVQPQLDDDGRELAERLRGLQGTEFDREYMEAMVDGHEEVKGMLEERVREIGHETPNAAAPAAGTAETTATGSAVQVETAVNQWAAKRLPSVSQHLEQARQIRERLDNNRRSTN